MVESLNLSKNAPLPGGDSLLLAIAGFGLRIHSNSQNLVRKLEEHYREFSAVVDDEINLHIEWSKKANIVQTLIPETKFLDNQILFSSPGCEGVYEFDRQYANLKMDTPRPFEIIEYFMRLIVAVKVFQMGGLLFHGAGISHKECGVVFFGPSGSGKTTVSRLSTYDYVLNDDLVLLLPGENGWMVNSTPFWNPTQIKPQPRSLPLFGLFRLVQAKKVYCTKPGRAAAVAEIAASVPVLSAEPGYGDELIARAEVVTQSVPVFRLHFLPDDTFWSVVEPLIGLS